MTAKVTLLCQESPLTLLGSHHVERDSCLCGLGHFSDMSLNHLRDNPD